MISFACYIMRKECHPCRHHWKIVKNPEFTNDKSRIISATISVLPFSWQARLPLMQSFLPHFAALQYVCWSSGRWYKKKCQQDVQFFPINNKSLFQRKQDCTGFTLKNIYIHNIQIWYWDDSHYDGFLFPVLNLLLHYWLPSNHKSKRILDQLTASSTKELYLSLKGSHYLIWTPLPNSSFFAKIPMGPFVYSVLNSEKFVEKGGFPSNK